MRTMQLLTAFAGDEQGATAIEYGLIAALIATIAIVGMTTLGGGLSGIFGFISNRSTAVWDSAGTPAT